MKKDQQLYEQKMNEMVDVYKKVAPLCITQRQAMEKVVNHPASRFFIQPHTAYNRLRHVFAGRTTVIPAVKDCEKELYEELYRRVMALSQHPDHYGKPLSKLCEIAVHQPAPKFYMKPAAFRGVLAYQRKLIRERLKAKRYADN